MTNAELTSLIEHIRYQATTWLGDEACENIERLIKYATLLHERSQRYDELLRNGYRMVQKNDHE